MDKRLTFASSRAALIRATASGSVQCGGVRIAYIKLVPLTPTEVDVLQAEQWGGTHRRLFAHNDSHGPALPLSSYLR